MSEIIYPSSNNLSGPWLLDFQQLQQLDSIISMQWEKLSKYRENLIKEEIEKDISSYPIERQEIKRKQVEERIWDNYRYKNFNKILSIKYKSERTLKVESFKEAAMHKEFENDMPLNFSYKINCVNIEAEIKSDYYSNNKIEYSVNTYSIPEAKELYYELEAWLKRVKPSFLVKIWRKIGPWILPIYLFTILLLPSNTITNKDILIQEAHKLLDDGISNEEISKALEIILSLETNFESNLQNTEVKEINYSRTYFILAIFLCTLILAFPPRNILGIGKGEKKLNRWRSWIKIVTYVIPVLIILPLIINKLSNLL